MGTKTCITTFVSAVLIAFALLATPVVAAPAAVAPALFEIFVVKKFVDAGRGVEKTNQQAQNTLSSANTAISNADKTMAEAVQSFKANWPYIMYTGSGLAALFALMMILSIMRNIRDLLRPARARR